MIYVSNIVDLALNTRAVRPSHLVSLVESEAQPQRPPEIQPERHLRIKINDITIPFAGHVAPEHHHIRALIDFIDGWPTDEPILVHCIAGISRSTATALITASIKAPGTEAESAWNLRQAAPHAQPNQRMIALADEILGRRGRLIAARNAMGPAVPAMQGPLVMIPIPAARNGGPEEKNASKSQDIMSYA